MNDGVVMPLTETKLIAVCRAGQQENWALRHPGFCLAVPSGILSRWEVLQS